MRIGFLYSRARVEEKLLLKALDQTTAEVDLIDVRTAQFNFDDREAWAKYDVILERCVSHTRALAALQILNGWGIPTVNTAHVAQLCGDKMATSQALVENKIPTPETRIAFTPEAALRAIEEMGYPVVLKPAVGSWGRLLTKVNDRDSAESILEHKSVLGGVHHSIFYIQEYIDKRGGQDIRSFVVDDETICAISRSSSHWITNTARGGQSAAFKVSLEIDDLSRRAAHAVGGGVVAVDLMAGSDGYYMVNEVNYTMEFRNSIEPTGVDIPARIIDYVLQVGEGRPVGAPTVPIMYQNGHHRN